MTRAMRRAKRGQSIVLMAVMCALIAFTLFTTFSIGKAIKERIQIQQAADASAYSLAVMEARAFNFYAYTNRAIVSHFVAMMSIYGHMSYLAYYDGILHNLATAWGCPGGDTTFNIQDQLEAEAVGWCLGCGPWCPLCCENCAGDAECVPQEIDSINQACNTLHSKMNDLDTEVGYPSSTGSCFKDLHELAVLHREGVGSGGSIGPISLSMGMSAMLRNEQGLMDNAVLAALGDPATLPPAGPGKGQDLTQAIANQFDPSYGVGKDKTHALLVTALSVIGPPGDSEKAGYCTAVTSPNPACKLAASKDDFTSLSTQQQAANASRYGPGVVGDWLRDRPDGILGPINVYMQFGLGFSLPYQINTLVSGDGMSRETTDAKKNGALSVIHSTSQGGCNGAGCGSGGGGSTSLAAEDHGTMVNSDIACVEWMTFGIYGSSPQSYVYSMPKGDGPSMVQWGNGQQYTTDDYDMGGKEPGSNSNRYGLGYATINFNPSADPASLFNQPHTWAVVTKTFNNSDLTTAPSGNTYGAADQGPSAMNRTFKWNGISYTYNNGITLPKGDPNYKEGREALYGLSQGLAYYHRPGDWQEPPNFYNPFWRAKLQPVQLSNGGSQVKAKLDVLEALTAAGYPPAAGAQISLLPVTE
ncbi:MAG: TadE/TadG family type IV pilus assembly protein [Myxococcales bacterium]